MADTWQQILKWRFQVVPVVDNGNNLEFLRGLVRIGLASGLLPVVKSCTECIRGIVIIPLGIEVRHFGHKT